MIHTDDQRPQDTKESLEERLNDFIGMENIPVPDEIQTEMVQQILQDYETDKKSMKDWFDDSKQGLELAKLTKQDKNYPFKGAANIKFPMVTSAALSFNAKTYQAVVPGGKPVLAKVHGEDPQGAKAARATRVSDYTSYQLLEEIPGWETDMDRLTFIGPVVGMMFKKVWFDPAMNEIRSKLCLPGKVIINHNIAHIGDAPAITEELEFQQHEIETKVRTGIWTDVDLNLPKDDKNKPVKFLEQHMRYDLDKDGYDEPYIVVVHNESKKIVRIITNFDLDDVMLNKNKDRILAIKPKTYFVDYTFLPAFDGGFHGSGMGMLLGDISESVNTTMNLLMDAGHFQAMPSGMIGGQDLRLKPGIRRIAPGEWPTVNAGGDDIRKGMVQFTIPAPSDVLFKMLGLLIEMGKEISSSKDITPEQAKQMTATTTTVLVEQGERVYNASFKRLYRSLKREFKLMFKINKGLSEEKYNAYFDDSDDEGNAIKYNPAEDFDLKGMDISPAADPTTVTKAQKAAKAQLLMELSAEGRLDPQEAMIRVLTAMDIEDIEKLMPKQTPMDKMLQQMQMYSAGLSLRMQGAELDNKMSDTLKNIAQAEGEEEGSQMREYMEVLKTMKQELDNESARFGIMAQGPGNGKNTGNNGSAP